MIPTTDDSKTRAQRAFRAHLALWTNPTMTREAYASLLTEDAVHEYPYAPAGFPKRVEGRDAITAYMVNLPQSATDWNFTDPTFLATSEPDMVFVEFEGGAFVTATGKTYHQIYIGRITLRGEQIAHYREFWNPSWTLDAFGTGPSTVSYISHRHLAENRLHETLSRFRFSWHRPLLQVSWGIEYTEK